MERSEVKNPENHRCTGECDRPQNSGYPIIGRKPGYMTSPHEYVLITGASFGLGEELARQLAARGWSLVLVARSQDRLERLRAELIAKHSGIDVRCIGMDLTASDAPAKLFAETQAAGLEIVLLINNAGFGAFGEFSSIGRERQRQMIDLNIAALVELTHLYLQPMYRQSAAQRHRGGIINIASIAGFVPLPYSTVYAATKAFVRSFSQSLSEEARQHGVHVMVVNPGTTETNFFEVAGKVLTISHSGSRQPHRLWVNLCGPSIEAGTPS